ncbi:hypothetical protein [Cerasicoccus arenae]|uniref:Uncharacterized protein n=1 Tax=Cerasicoccus arenae TaxID=424488 RepID=A0A8J3DJZ0_9BACT|nr:hypothetical protein [Cerasicoccus arenae]MBK1860053.1 hypothetical protein [Cerasicoccus arenae]GHC08458.1 hypothetical protein GCM10007047_27180 [Cerasicoccus arenae]
MKVKITRAKILGYDISTLSDAELAKGIRLTDSDDDHIIICDSGKPKKIKADIKAEIIDVDITEKGIRQLTGHFATFLYRDGIMIDLKKHQDVQTVEE